MKASEMTNKELAIQIEAYNTVSGCSCSKCEYMREAARRLWSMTVRADNSAVIAELQRRLKVAEDALEASLNYHNSEELRKAQHKAECALAEIREKGDSK